MTEQFSQADVDAAIAAAKKGYRRALGLVPGAGDRAVLAGVAAIAFPLLSTIAAKIALGWIFLAGGVVLVIHAFSIKEWRGFLMGCCSACSISWPAAGSRSFRSPASSR